MDFPTHVKIGWKRFKIEVWDPVGAAREHMYGQCDHLASTIRIDTSHGPHQALETLIHECYHAAFDVGGMGRVEGHDHRYTEEAVVSYLAGWHMTLMSDNPHLLAWPFFPQRFCSDDRRHNIAQRSA